MPVIIAPGDYARWRGDAPDPRDLMRPFPAGLMRMWPISTRVNKPENDDRSIVEPIEVAAGIAQKSAALGHYAGERVAAATIAIRNILFILRSAFCPALFGFARGCLASGDGPFFNNKIFQPLSFLDCSDQPSWPCAAPCPGIAGPVTVFDGHPPSFKC